MCYVSILFAPFLFPLIVWLASKEDDVKETAMEAFKLHLIPVGLTVIALIIIGMIAAISGGGQSAGAIGSVIFILVGIVDFALVIYNLVLGYRIFKT